MINTLYVLFKINNSLSFMDLHMHLIKEKKNQLKFYINRGIESFAVSAFEYYIFIYLSVLIIQFVIHFFFTFCFILFLLLLLIST